MSWTDGLWPVSSSTTALLTACQELRTNLNARITHDLCPAISDGDALYTAIADLRSSVNASITEFYDPETGKAFVACGANGSSGDAGNLWQRLFGSARRAWRNRDDGTEAASPNWLPEKCNLQDSDPYSFLLNELQQVIDAMGWKRLSVNPYLAGIWKPGTPSPPGSDAGSESDSLSAAWTAALAPAAQAAGANQPAYVHAAYYRASLTPLVYDCAFNPIRRAFASFDLPASATQVRVVTNGSLSTGLISLDQYDKDNGGSRQTIGNPDWTWSIWIGTANDQTIWDYGVLFCQYNASQANAPWTALPAGNWTAGATNYIQVRAGDDVRPDHLASTGYWGHGGGDFSSYDKRVLPPIWVLYKVVP